MTVATITVAGAGMPYFPERLVGTWCSIHNSDQFVKAQECESIADTLIIDSGEFTWSHDHCLLDRDSLGIGDAVHRKDDKTKGPYVAHFTCQGRDGPFDRKRSLTFTVKENVLTVRSAGKRT
jgi:hypothetical protein